MMKNRVAEIKDVIRTYYSQARCGCFFCHNHAGNTLQTVYNSNGIQVDVCYGWEYFEIFGLNEAEEKEVEDYYYTLGGRA